MTEARRVTGFCFDRTLNLPGLLEICTKGADGLGKIHWNHRTLHVPRGKETQEIQKNQRETREVLKTLHHTIFGGTGFKLFVSFVFLLEKKWKLGLGQTWIKLSGLLLSSENVEEFKKRPFKVMNSSNLIVLYELQWENNRLIKFLTIHCAAWSSFI